MAKRPVILRQGDPSKYESRPKQPYFKCYYGNPRIDITDSVAKASYDERADLMTELVITCRNAEWLYSFVLLGGTITFYGGDLTASGTVNYRKIFGGLIKFIKSDYQDNGRVYAVITAQMSNSAITSSTTTLSASYPDISPSARDFVTKYLIKEYNLNPEDYYETSDSNHFFVPNKSLSVQDQTLLPGPQLNLGNDDQIAQQKLGALAENVFMTYTAIVEGIADENGWLHTYESIDINKELDKDTSKLPNLTTPITQDNQSDWSFLIKLGTVLDCQCWLEPIGDTDEFVLFFQDTRKLRDKERFTISANGVRIESPRFEFFFPRRDDVTYSNNGDGTKLFSDRFIRRTKEFRARNSFGGGTIQLQNVAVIEDVGMMNAIKPGASNSVGEDQGVEYRTVVRLPAAFAKYDASDTDVKALFNAGEELELIVRNGETYYRIPESRVSRFKNSFGEIVAVANPVEFSSLKVDYASTIFEDRDFIVEVEPDYVKSLPEAEYQSLMKAIKSNNFMNNDTYAKVTRIVPLPLEREIRQKPFDWRGVRISATIDGNVNVKSQRFFRVVGIIRYGTDQDDEPFYLRALTHTWDDSKGFSTKLEFFK